VITLRLSREFYSRHGEIAGWLFENVGEGGQWRRDWPDNWLWDFSVIFGHADIRFRNNDDAMLFSLTWLGQEGRDD
jgi:hypothetical protein